MLLRVILAALLSTAVGSGIAFGQSAAPDPSATIQQSKPSSGGSMKSSSASQQQSLPQQIKTKLKDQGFTEVNVVPDSFLVTAKDKQGDPVTMVVGPHSMSIFPASSSAGSLTGGGSSAHDHNDDHD